MTVDATTHVAVPGRLERKRSRRRAQILAVAAELFGERGFNGVSLGDVAERLDVTKGSLYYYFASKDELGTAAIEALGSEWTSRLEVLAADGGTAAERLAALIHEHVRIAVREYPAALRLFLAPHEWPQSQRDRIKKLRRRHDQLFRDLMVAGVQGDEFTVADIDTALQCMHAAMSQAPLWCADLSRRAQDSAIDKVTVTLMALVGHAPSPS